ncbi:hypothetical protein AHAS_Ahas05G0203800 [Arachis hypogaea]
MIPDPFIRKRYCFSPIFIISRITQTFILSFFTFTIPSASFILSRSPSWIRQLRPRIQAITTSNVAVAAHMETEAIIEHWFAGEAEGSNQSGRQCGYGDVKAEEEGDGNDDDKF